MTVISKTEFAARRGWAKSYVSKLANQDRLVLTDDGKVELEATEALLAESADPSKAAVADRHNRLRLEREAKIATEEPAVPQVGQAVDFQKSRALREHYLALQEQDNYRKQQGTRWIAKQWKPVPTMRAVCCAINCLACPHSLRQSWLQ